MTYERKLIRFKTARKRKEIKECFILLATGLFAGALCGFFGGGGGSVIVPALTVFLKEKQKNAQATALPIMLFVSASSAAVYANNGLYKADITVFCILGSLVGSVLGSFLLNKLNNKFLSVLFYAIMIFAGVKTIL